MYIYIYIYKCDFGLSVYPINFIMAYLMYIRCKLVPPTSNALGVDSDGSRPSGSQGADVMGRWIETPTKMEISSLCSMLVSEMDRWMDEGIEVDSDMMS